MTINSSNTQKYIAMVGGTIMRCQSGWWGARTRHAMARGDGASVARDGPRAFRSAAPEGPAIKLEEPVLHLAASRSAVALPTASSVVSSVWALIQEMARSRWLRTALRRRRSRRMRGLFLRGLMELSPKSRTQYSLLVIRLIRRRTTGEEGPSVPQNR